VALAFFGNVHAYAHQLWSSRIAARRGHHELASGASSLKKGETLLDTVFNLYAMKPDCLVMRHAASGATDYVARHLDIPVVNAGDGTHEHPSQGLLDALTIRDRLGTIKNLNVDDSGDIVHSRVARSNIHLLGKFGCNSRCAGRRCGCRASWKKSRGDSNSLRLPDRRGPDGADVIMMLRVQTERLDDPPPFCQRLRFAVPIECGTATPREPECDCAASGADEPRD